MGMRIGGWLIAGSLLSVATTVLAAPSQHNETTVNYFADGSFVAGSSSTLVTNDAGATMTLHTSDLPAGHVITVWWVVFNHPENCTSGEGGLRCGEGDLFNEAVERRSCTRLVT